MTRLFAFLALLFTYSTVSFAQVSIKGKHTEDITIKKDTKKLHINYSFKKKTTEAQLLKIKFSNKTKQNLNVDLVIGIYSNGVLLEKADIVDCLKKPFWNNWFRPYHLIETSVGDKSNIEINVLNLYTESVDECRPTHK